MKFAVYHGMLSLTGHIQFACCYGQVSKLHWSAELSRVLADIEWHIDLCLAAIAKAWQSHYAVHTWLWP